MVPFSKPTATLDWDTHVNALLVRFFREEWGQDLIEYGLLIGVITATSTLTIKSLGGIIFEFYNGLQQNLVE